MILVSCFEPFGGERRNSTQEVCRVLEQENIKDVHFCVLPVVWKRSFDVLSKEIDVLKPRAVLCLGQAKREGIELERLAHNWDDFRIPDNAGLQIQQREIIAGESKQLRSTLPLLDLKNALEEAMIPTRFSDSAGTFVCNHLFYSLQHACKNQAIISGFVHIPQLPEQAKEGDSSMSLMQQIQAVRVMIMALLQSISV